MREGDKVRIVSVENKMDHGIPVGTVLTVSEMDDDGTFSANYEGWVYWIDQDEAEVVASE